MKSKSSYFNIEVGRHDDVWIDDCSFSLKEFQEDLPEYMGIKKEFRVIKACWLVTDGQVNKVKNLIKDNGGTLV